MKRIRHIADPPTNPDAEVSDKLDGDEVEVSNPLVGHYSSSSPKEFHSHLIPITPRNFQPVLSSVPSSVPPPSPKSSNDRPIVASPMKPSPIPQPQPSPVLTSHI
ncbi:hypothetical protein O181_041208 [Austropuccinia psidii MF-1]|uniref:Uncharacterized protein n=1 Tax=Austropuccinia psidii MF-1 TaxID=1389203 RepID=A0A9Q3DIQ9_9BASI|nr:hypothetical protein [Austropuccinia psidii MF-1]